MKVITIICILLLFTINVFADESANNIISNDTFKVTVHGFEYYDQFESLRYEENYFYFVGEATWENISDQKAYVDMPHLIAEYGIKAYHLTHEYVDKFGFPPLIPVIYLLPSERITFKFAYKIYIDMPIVISWKLLDDINAVFIADAY